MPDDSGLDAVVQAGQRGLYVGPCAVGQAKADVGLASERAMIGHKPGWLSLQEGLRRARKNSLPAPLVLDPLTPRRSLEPLPAHLQRKIDQRWREWEPWVWIDLRHRGIAPGGRGCRAILKMLIAVMLASSLPQEFHSQTFCSYNAGSSPDGPGLHGIALRYV